MRNTNTDDCSIICTQIGSNKALKQLGGMFSNQMLGAEEAVGQSGAESYFMQKFNNLGLQFYKIIHFFAQQYNLSCIYLGFKSSQIKFDLADIVRQLPRFESLLSGSITQFGQNTITVFT